MGYGKVHGPESNIVGTPDWHATQIWTNSIYPPKVHGPTQPSGIDKPVKEPVSAGSIVGGLLAMIIVVVAVANGIPLGSILVLLVGIVVVWAFRKALFKLAGVAVLVYGLYLVFK
jgi:hypothetical protein